MFQSSNTEKETSVDTVAFYFRDIRNIPVLTQQEELDLARAMKAGSAKAREALIIANLRLVASIVKSRARNTQTLDYADLIQMGNEALMEHALKFDPESGNKFSTFATQVVKNALANKIDETDRTIPLGRVVCKGLRKMNREQNRFYAQHGRKPSDAELRNLMGYSEEKFSYLQSSNLSHSSIDGGQGEHGEGGSYEYLVDSAIGPEESAARDSLRGAVDGLLKILTPLERAVVVRIFQIGDGRAGDDPEYIAIAKELGISDDKLRKIRNGAYAKMRPLAESCR
jgi:RNA polymerase primary sigma factor